MATAARGSCSSLSGSGAEGMAEEGEEKGWSRAGKGRAVWLSSGAAAQFSGGAPVSSRKRRKQRDGEREGRRGNRVR